MSKFFKHIRINGHAIELVNGQQPSYWPIYSLESIGLEIMNISIKSNLANRFIKLSKSFTSTPIFFNKKSDRFFGYISIIKTLIIS